MMLRTIIFLTIFATMCKSQLVGQGACPQPTPMANFNQSNFAGTWNTITQYPTVYETIARCPTITYGLNGDGTYSITENEILMVDPTQSKVSWSGVGRFDNSTIGTWRWNFPIANINFPNIPYIVIATDYDTYATVYSCVSFDTTYFAFLWIMTKRYPLFVPQSSIQAGIDAAANAGLNTAYVVPAIQLLCTFPSFQDIMKWLGWA